MVLAAGVGVLAAAAGSVLAEDGLLLAAAVSLLAPLLVSLILLVRHRRGVVPLLVSLASMLLFLPRLLTVEPQTGLLAAAHLTPGEFEQALRTTQHVLIVFGVVLALAIGATARHPAVLVRWRRSTVHAGSASMLEQTVRVRVAIVIGLVTSTAALVTGVTQGVAARDFENIAKSGPLGLLSTGPAAGALWLAGRRRIGLVVLAFSMTGPFLIGGRQAVLTPLLYFMAAFVVRRRAAASTAQQLTTRVVVSWGLLAVIVVTAAVLATTSRRATVDKALNKGVQSSLYTRVIEQQTLLDPLLVAVAREDRPQGMRIYRRALAIPVPRMLWPDKPLSYDYHFRERQFPHFGGGIPITLVGTAFLSFLLPGVALAALLLGVAAVAAEVAVSGRTARSVLGGVVACLFLLDVVRIGGLYREVLTAAIDVALIMVLTRRARPPLVGPPEDAASRARLEPAPAGDQPVKR